VGTPTHKDSRGLARTRAIAHYVDVGTPTHKDSEDWPQKGAITHAEEWPLQGPLLIWSLWECQPTMTAKEWLTPISNVAGRWKLRSIGLFRRLSRSGGFERHRRKGGAARERRDFFLVV